jgi:transposase-like protein
MPRKSFRPEEITAKLREADVPLGQGKRVAEVVKALGVSEATYYRWRQEYGGLSVSQARRLKELERENARLRRAVADLTLDKQILKEAAEGNF